MRKILIPVTLAIAAILTAFEFSAIAGPKSDMTRYIRKAPAPKIDPENRFYSSEEWQNVEQAKFEDPDRGTPNRVSTDYSIYAYSRTFTIPVAYENLNLDIFCDVGTQNKLSISTVFTPDGNGGYDGLFQKKIFIKKVKVKMKSSWECKKKEAGQDAAVADFTFNQDLHSYSEYTNHGFTIFKFYANGATTKVVYSGHLAIRKNTYASNQKSASKDGTEEKLAFLKQQLPIVLKK